VGTALNAFEADWLVERGIEIISEAGRRLPGELKRRHPEIPWRKIAGVGNVLRDEYERNCPGRALERRTRGPSCSREGLS
jgi:hypothetical protein